MSSTIYTNIKIFSVKLAKPVSSTSSLFPIESGIVVLAQTHDSNVYPSNPSWGFLFVGEESEFVNDALPELKKDFDSGRCHGSFASNGNNFVQAIMELLVNKQDILCISLNHLGFNGYSFSSREYDELSCKHGFVAKELFGEVRYCHPLNKLPDVKRMVHHVLTLKQESKSTSSWWQNRPFKIESFESVTFPKIA